MNKFQTPVSKGNGHKREGKHMGGGGGGEPKIPKEIQRLADELLQSGEVSFLQGIPLAEAGGADALEILRGGIPESLRPAITSATEQGRAAESAGQREFFENLVRGGVTGSEFLTQTGAQQLAGEQRVADIPTSFTLPVLQQTAGAALGLPAEGLGDISQAAQILAGGSQPSRQRGGVVGGVSGAAAGAGSGAAIGSVFPGYGTAIGAVAGALIGGFAGSQ